MSVLFAQSDAGVSFLFNPGNSCEALSSGVPLQIQYNNFGAANIQPTVSVGYQVGNGTPVIETAPGLNAGSANLYTFTTLAVFPLPNTLYQIKVWTQVAGDPNVANDTFQLSVISPILVTLPFSETFETFSQGAPGFLNNGWGRVSSNFQNWYVSNGPVPFTENTTGPTNNHTPGGTRYVFSEATSGSAGDTMAIFTPCIDLGGSTAPRLVFWYHMFGANMGTFRVVVRNFSAGTISTVWSLTGQQQTSNAADWLEAAIDLTAFAGDIIQVRFVSERGGGNLSDVALDDVFIFDPLPTDVGVVDVSPTGASCYSAAEEIDATFVNFGSQALDFSLNPVTVTVDLTPPGGGPVQSFNATVNTGTLNVLDSLTLQVTNLADFSATGLYNYLSYTTLAGDNLDFNDTLDFKTAEAIQSFTTPFFENFETFTPGISAFNPGVYANGWTRTFNNAGLSWFIDDGILFSSTGTGADFDHTPAPGTRWAYLETSGGGLGDSAEIRSPCITLSGTAILLEFWYHMFGSDMGDMVLYLDDKTTGQVTKLWELSGQQQLTDIEPWRSATINLNPYLGHAVQLVWRGFRGNGFESDMGIDDILVYEPPAYDVAVTRILDPLPACDLSASEPVSIEIINFGSDTLTNIQAFYAVDAGPFTVPEPVGVVLPPGDTVIHSFTVPANLSGLGNHTIVAVAQQLVPLDTLVSNDTVRAFINNTGGSISSFPYYEDFESGQGGWEDSVIAPSVTESWAFGTPSKLTIAGAASGANAWVTGGLSTGSYFSNERSYVYSPCFDLTSLSDPIVRLDVWWESVDFQDGAVLQYSGDGGNTWTTIGDVGDPINWYTQGGINGLPGGGPIGWAGRSNTNTGSNGWVKAERSIPALAGAAGVVFRIAFGSDVFTTDDGFAFDNFEVFERPQFDASVTAIIEPESGCGLTANSTVIIQLTNIGAQAFDTVNLSFTVGTSGVVVTELLDSLINPGDTVTYTFTTGADFSTPGLYDFSAWTSLQGDTAVNNDTLTVPIQAIQTVSQYPYVEDYASGVNGWQSGGVNSTWAFGEPAKQTISGAASDTNAWVTGGLFGSYVNQENSFVLGPCFDFSTLTNPTLRLSIFVESEFSWDGAAVQTSVNNGATWQLVGSFNSPQGINWYNDNTISGNPGGQQQGWTGRSNTNNGTNQWVTAQHPLTGLAGQSEVLIRVVFGTDFSVIDEGFAFDNFIVFDRALVDIGTTGMTVLPPNGCIGDTVAIGLDITNYGTVAQSNIPMEVAVTGPMGTTTLSGIYAPNLVPNDTVTAAFGTFVATMPGTYELVSYSVISGDTTFFHDSSFASITINPIAIDPIVAGDSLCSAGNSSLTLTGSSGSADILWFDTPAGGTVLGEGNTFNTPNINTTTTFYAQATTTTSGQLGLATNFAGAGSFFSITGTGMRFSVFNTLILKSLRVYPNSAGVITLRLLEGGVVQETRTFNYGGTGADTTLTLNWFIDPGLNYQIDASGTSVGAGLYRNTAGITYPYEIPGVISITGNTLNQSGVYYFFYNWQIEILDCPSNRVPVQAVLQPPVSVNLGPDGAQCSGFTLNGTAPGATSYIWNNNPAVNSPIIQADTTGVYTVTVSNAAGCTDTDSVVLFIKQTPEVTVSPAIAQDCDSVALEVDSVSGATYFWLGPNPTSQPTNQPTFLATQSGNYYATVTVDGCVGRDTSVITILPGPPVNLGNNQQTCDTILLDAGPGISYLWSTGETTQTITVPPLGSGSQTISVMVTDGSGCPGQDEVIISQANPPVVNLGPDQQACGQVTLDAGNPGNSYLWSSGQTSQAITVSQTGTYVVEVTNAFSCVASDSVDIQVDPIPVANASYTGPVNGNIVTFLNNSTPANASYQWTFGDGTGVDTSAQPVHTYFVPGNFVVTLIVTNDCGSDTTTLFIQNVVASLSDNWFGQGMEVYPNPSDGLFTLRANDLAPDQLHLEITDVRGRTVMEREMQHLGGDLQTSFDLSHLGEGLYQIRVIGQTQQGIQRIQVK
jgi:hypothetical protein